MKGLLKILAGGFVVFMALSIVQEWEFFASSWFGRETRRPALTEEDRKAAAEAVRTTLTLMRHFYASGGDPRFAERMPASGGIVDEMQADVDYVSRNHRVQDPELVRQEVLSVEELGEDRVEVRTRELWRVRILWAVGGGDAEPPAVQVTYGKYLVVRGGRGWRVEGWDVTEPPVDGENPPP